MRHKSPFDLANLFHLRYCPDLQHAYKGTISTKLIYLRINRWTEANCCLVLQFQFIKLMRDTVRSDLLGYPAAVEAVGKAIGEPYACNLFEARRIQ